MVRHIASCLTAAAVVLLGSSFAIPAPPLAAQSSMPDVASLAGTEPLGLLHGRFEIEVDWRDFQGRSGRGEVVALTPETVYVWFFAPGNVELLLKVLDGTPLNGHYWVYYGALSNVEYRILIRDTWTGRVRVYDNPAGQFASRADTRAFPG